jgi:hypothetical protein
MRVTSCGPILLTWSSCLLQLHRCAAAGLPEEVRISSTALARGYALLALSSRDRAFSRCWAVPHHPDMPSNDVHSVSGRAQHWMRLGVEQRTGLVAAGCVGVQAAHGPCTG